LRRAAWALLALSVILGVIATYYGIGESAESQPNAAAGRAADVLWICAGVAFVVCVPGALWSDSERRRGR
jgi:hypothetical protein